MNTVPYDISPFGAGAGRKAGVCHLAGGGGQAGTCVCLLDGWEKRPETGGRARDLAFGSQRLKDMKYFFSLHNDLEV